MANYTHGTVLLLTGKGVKSRERMIIRKGGQYFPLDTYTGNVVDILSLGEDFSSAEEVATAYRKAGYQVAVKTK